MKDERNVVGIQYVDFVPDGSDRKIEGYNFYFSDDFRDGKSIGFRTSKYWVPKGLCSGMKAELGKWEFDVSISSGSNKKVYVTGLRKLS